MFRFLFLVFFATFVYGQSELDGKCLVSTDLDPFNWEEFTGTMWYEIYRSDKSHNADCVHVMYEELGGDYLVHYAGEINEEHAMWRNLAKITGKSTYTLAGRVQTVVAYKKDSYAVVHECKNVGETKRKTYTWILSSMMDLSASNKTEIETALKAKGLDKEVRIADMSETHHHEDCHHHN